MNISSLIALLLTFSALTTYLDHRLLRLPTTVALILSSVGGFVVSAEEVRLIETLLFLSLDARKQI